MASRSKSTTTVGRPEWANRVSERRKNFQIPQTKMAALLGISQSAYADYETGRSEPSMRMFAALANLLDTKASWLAYGVGEREGELKFNFLATPVLASRREKDPLFTKVSDKVMELLREENFFPEDVSFVVVLSDKIVEQIRSAYVDTDEAVDMGIGNAEYNLKHFLRNTKMEQRIKLLTDPVIYLPVPIVKRFAR